ncbi:alpha/beta hydrolase [Rhodococcus tibetensis]|nr:alpha/beta hydrolase [Rhodococcus sp. FXJ9.536]
MNIRRSIIRAGLRSSRPLFASRRVSVGVKRRMVEMVTGAARPPRGTRFERVTIAGVPVERVLPPHPRIRGTLIYLHGGGYALGSAKGYRGLVAHLAAAAGMAAVIPDYSRSPAARYPIALEEVVAVYSQLIDDGLDPETTVIAGDSAGGGLTLAMAMTLRDHGIAAPAALGLISPWADLAIDVDELRPALRDPLILPSMTAEWARRYAGNHDPRTPGISPVHGDLTGLPPIVIHTAGDDPISVDADRIEAALVAVAGSVDHRRFDTLWHDFHLQVSILAEAREAVADLGAALGRHIVTTELLLAHPDNTKVAST